METYEVFVEKDQLNELSIRHVCSLESLKYYQEAADELYEVRESSLSVGPAAYKVVGDAWKNAQHDLGEFQLLQEGCSQCENPCQH